MKKRKCRVYKKPRTLTKESYQKGGKYSDPWEKQTRTNNVNFSNTYDVYDPYNAGMVDEKVGKSYPTVDTENATIEAEKGEYILKATGELFKIEGKPHSKGGTPIIAEDGDFIFSDHVRVKEDNLGFVDPSTKKKSKYYKKGKTPAELIKKFKLHTLNDYITKLDSDDPFTRKTAEISIAEINKKLAEIAFAQEQEKDEPSELPANLMANLPQLMNQDFNSQDQPQLKAKYGGYYNKLKKAQSGTMVKTNDDQPESASGAPLDFYKGFIPGFDEVYSNMEGMLTIPNIDYSNYGSQRKKGDYYGNISDANQRKVINDWYKRQTGNDIDFSNKEQVAKVQQLYFDEFKDFSGLEYNSGINNTTDGAWGNRTNSYIFGKKAIPGNKTGTINLNEYFNLPEEKQKELAKEYGLTSDNLELYRNTVVNELNITANSSKEELQTNEENIASEKYRIKAGDNEPTSREFKDYGYSRPEVMSMFNAGVNMLDNRATRPIRQQVSPRYSEVEKVDPTAANNMIRTQAFLLGEQLGLAMSPQAAAANAASLQGKTIQGVSNTSGQYDNTNAQLSNQNDNFNTQVSNQFAQLNTQLDDTYNVRTAQFNENQRGNRIAGRNAFVDTYGQIEPRRAYRNVLLNTMNPENFSIEDLEGNIAFNPADLFAFNSINSSNPSSPFDVIDSIMKKYPDLTSEQASTMYKNIKKQ